MDDPFVPPDFDPPVAFAWADFHLEPLGPEHNERDHVAWMTSIGHIGSTPGFSEGEQRGWPEPMSLEANLKDLVRHAKDFRERQGFTYSILEDDEVIGCIYIYPDRKTGHDAWVGSWVRESHAAFDDSVRQRLATWIDDEWPFTDAYYAGVSG